MAVITITKENFDQEVKNSDVPVLVDFWASWCGPCKMIAPVIDEISGEVSGKKVGKINVDEQPELAQAFGVMSIPTIMVFNKGEVAAKAVGVQPKQVLLDMLDK